jgi:hypothetical protein
VVLTSLKKIVLVSGSDKKVENIFALLIDVKATLQFLLTTSGLGNFHLKIALLLSGKSVESAEVKRTCLISLL